MCLLGEWLVCWVTVVGWLIGCLFRWSIVALADWLSVWSVVLWVGRLVDLFGWGMLVCWLICYMLGLSTVWLIDACFL